MVKVPGGTYSESLIDAIPAGVTLQAEEGATVIFRPTSGARVLNFGSGAAHDITVRGLVLDAANCTSDCVKVTGGAYNIRIENCEIMNSVNQGVLVSGADTHSVTVTGCHVHHNGKTDQHHGIYSWGDDTTLRGNECDHNSGHGIHIYGGAPETTWLVEWNYCHHNERGIGAYAGMGRVVNNVCRGNLVNLMLRYGLIAAEVWHNTLMEAVLQGLNVGNFSQPGTTVSAVNNVIVGGEIGVRLEDSATEPAIAIHHTLVSGQSVAQVSRASVQAGVTLALMSDVFAPVTDDGAAAVRPTAGNPAIGVGAALGVLTDYGGNLRASPPTVGAWE